MSSSEPHAGGGRFLATFAATAAALALALAALTWATDPIGYSSALPLPPGPCAPGIRTNDERFHKPVLSLVHRPEEIAIGSSRASWGFREEFFTASGSRRAANLALSGASLAEIDTLLRRAAAHAPVRRVWIGLDFGAFAFVDPAERGLSNPGGASGPARTTLRYGLADPRAWKAALLSLTDRSACDNPPFGPSGFVRDRGPYGPDEAAPPRLPDARARARRLLEWRARRAGGHGYAGHLRRFDDLLIFLDERDIQIVLFLSPSHPVFFEMIGEAGLRERHHQWRADMKAAARRRGALLVESDRPAFLATAAAEARCGGAPIADCLFYDATHFRPAVGAAIVREGLGRHVLVNAPSPGLIPSLPP